MELKTSDRNVAADARNAELAMYRQKLTGPCTVSLLVKSVLKLSTLTVLVENSDGGGSSVLSNGCGLNAEQISHANGISMTVPINASAANRAYVRASFDDTGNSAAKTVAAAISSHQ